MDRPLTFPAVKDDSRGVTFYRNAETNVTIHKGLRGTQTVWFITVPSRSATGSDIASVWPTLAAARPIARILARQMRLAAARAFLAAQSTPAPAPRPAPAAAPAAPAPAVLVFKARATNGNRTRYTTADGRYEIIGRKVAGSLGSDINPDRAFTPYRNGVAVGPSHRRLRDAQQAAQRDWDDLCKAHVSALLDEAARLAGDPDWRGASSGQMLQALAEDTRRATESRRRAGTGPRQLSGWGHLRAAHRAAAAV